MKKLVVVIAVVLIASLAFAAAPTGVTYGKAPVNKALKTDVLNSMHDLVTGAAIPYGYMPGTHANADAIPGSAGSPCYVCHIPHKTGAKPVAGIGTLLWNVKINNFGAAYGTYGSDFATAIGLAPTELNGQITNSNLCLSCHDGAVALGTYYQNGFWTGTPTNPIGAGMQIQDLTETHPINFMYAGATFADDKYVKLPADVNSVDGNGDIPLYQGKMQCGTCHDVHAGKNYFSRPFPAGKNDAANRGEMCTYCHL